MPNLPIPNLIAVLLVGLVAALSGVLLIANGVVWMAIVTLVLAAVLIAVAVAGLRARLRNRGRKVARLAGDALQSRRSRPQRASAARRDRRRRSSRGAAASAEPASEPRSATETGIPAAIADVGGAGWEAACVEVPEDFPVTTTPPAPTTGTPDLVHNTTTRTARCLSGNSHTSWPRTAARSGVASGPVNLAAALLGAAATDPGPRRARRRGRSRDATASSPRAPRAAARCSRPASTRATGSCSSRATSPRSCRRISATLARGRRSRCR